MLASKGRVPMTMRTHPVDRRLWFVSLAMIVAIVASYLAVRMRRESETVQKREKEIRDLYAFSRRLASVHSTSDIFDAIQKHLSALVERKVVLFEPRRPVDGDRQKLTRAAAMSRLVDQVPERMCQPYAACSSPAACRCSAISAAFSSTDPGSDSWIAAARRRCHLARSDFSCDS